MSEGKIKLFRIVFVVLSSIGGIGEAVLGFLSFKNKNKNNKKSL